MDLINAYLRAVAALLPRGQRDDITAELRDIILSRIEAREAALGRRLTDAEIEQELRAVGHPIVVAARYREEPQQVVGPALYPYWMFAVKIAIAIQAAAVLVLLILRTLQGQDFGNALGHAIGQGITGFVTLIGVATVAAWAIERRKIHIAYLDQWRVRDLHVLEYAGWDIGDLRDHVRRRQAARGMPAPVWRHHHRPSPVGEALFLIAFGTVFILWWVGVIPLTFFAPAEGLRRFGENLSTIAGMNLGDLHTLLFWPVLAYGGAIIVQGVLVLLYPGMMWLRGLLAILMGVAMLGFCIWIWTVSPIAAAIRVGSVAELLGRLKQSIHQGMPLSLAPILTVCLACAAFGAVTSIVKGLWQMLILPWQDDRVRD